MKKVLRIFSYIIGLSVILSITLIDKIDFSPYQDTDYYKAMKLQLDTAKFSAEIEKENVLAGWDKVNITPSKSLKTAGYGITEPFESVSDSIWTRTIYIGSKEEGTAIISVDLLIFPPLLAKDLEKELKESGERINLFLSASHTHSSAGGWSKGIAGGLMAGGYDQDYYDELKDKLLRSIRIAKQSAKPAAFSYGRINAQNLLYNRLVNEKGIVYPWLNLIKIEKVDGKTAILSSFSAHATCNIPKDKAISRDYPGILVDALEKSEYVEFSSFLSGGVGSHGPNHGLVHDRVLLSSAIADSLKRKTLSGLDHLERIDNPSTSYLKLKLPLRDPHLKISNQLRLRPWVYNFLMGNDQDINLKAFQIGNLLLVGTPCDFSGELIPQLDSIANKRGIELIVTSFNGAYIGYITKDEHYDLVKSETREMNWFGPYNGAYFNEVISEIIKKAR
jgi:neutral ceramidase